MAARLRHEAQYRRGVVRYFSNGKLFKRATFCIPKQIYAIESGSVEFASKTVSNRERTFALYFVPYNPIRWYEVERTEITRGVFIGRGERRPSRPRARLGTGLLKGRATKLGYELRHTDTARRESRDAMQGLCFFCLLSSPGV